MHRYLPTPESIRNSRLLRWLGPRLHDRELWRMHRRRVARGVAIGLFFAFLTPIAQIPIAALVAFALRANLVASAGATLVSNPFTYAPIFFVAYRLGAWILGMPAEVSVLGDNVPDDAGLLAWVAFWSDRLHALGKPLFVGLAAMAVIASTLGYFTTMIVWRIAVVLKRRRALRARAGR